MIKITGILGGAAIAGLAAGTFAIGSHLGPDRSVGQNLYRQHSNLVQVSSTSNVLPASYTGNPALYSAKVAVDASKPVSTTVAAASTDDSSADDDDFTVDGPGATFEQVYVLLKHNYVDGVPSDAHLGHGAAAAMISSLDDPESRFMEEPEVRELLSEQKGTYHGIGAVTAIRVVKHDTGDPDTSYTEYRLTIVAPLTGTPAEKAGLLPGDVITHLNGHWVAGYDPVAANAKKLKDAQDDPIAFNALVANIQQQTDTSLSLTETEAQLDDVTLPPDPTDLDKKVDDTPTPSVTLTVERPGMTTPLTITVANNQTTDVDPVISKQLPGNIGYIHITQFGDATDKALDSALTGFGTDVKGLIVDLRDTPGGDVDTAADVDGKISGAKFLGLVEGKGKSLRQIAVRTNREVNCPIAVLVNDGTANTAELLAASLQDQGYKLVGVKTFGDAMEVAPVSLRDGSGFTMTIGQFFTLSHKPFNDTGLTPDVVVQAGAGDPQLDQAIAALAGRTAKSATPAHVDREAVRVNSPIDSAHAVKPHLIPVTGRVATGPSVRG